MTDRYAVIGNPIAHSKSSLIHGMFAKATGQDLEYTKIEGPLDGIADAVRKFRDAGGRGMNITVPFKRMAMAGKRVLLLGAGGAARGVLLPFLQQRPDLVVNGTSASQQGQLPPISAAVFRSDGLAYEMLYGKGLTPFLRLAKSAGVKRMADGVGMLAEQAAEAFMWWRGVRPDTRAVIEALAVPLV